MIALSALGLAIVILSAMVGGILYVRKAERDAMRLKEEEADAETAKRIAAAVAASPRDDDAFDKRLRDPKKGL